MKGDCYHRTWQPHSSHTDHIYKQAEHLLRLANVRLTNFIFQSNSSSGSTIPFEELPFNPDHDLTNGPL
ncbi:hypothetical protein NQZ68_003955 [Dissostichus eleginoides]|nr:hypothetical protein NQZ68_003955 [Dissostichus eleginoides]